jgi:hypothetical protein
MFATVDLYLQMSEHKVQGGMQHSKERIYKMHVLHGSTPFSSAA